MVEEEKSLKPQKEANKESLADSKKIDLYINNNDQYAEQGISIMNVFSRLRQRFHIYIWVILLGLIAGLTVPVMMYTFRDKQETGISIVGLDYKGADQGLAPDGTALDISYIKSSFIVQNALSSVNLSKKVSAAQVQDNVKITGVLTDETKQQKEILEKLAEEKSTAYAETLKNFTLKYKAQYIITVDSVFKDGNKKVKLTTTDLSTLLNGLTSAYAEYFADTYQDKSLPDNLLGAIDAESLDFLDMLDEISESFDYLEKYCNTKAATYSNFRNSAGLSFEDLSSTIATLRSTDLISAYGDIDLNNISRNPTIQLNNYQYQRREANSKLNEVKENIASKQTEIDNYKPDTVVIPASDGDGYKSVDRTSDYYNQLVLEMTQLNENKSELEERIAILDSRIDKLQGQPATAEQVANAEKEVNDLLESAKDVYDLVNSSTDELFRSNAYNDRYMHAVVTTESEKFTDNLKQFGIGAAVGLAIGLVLWAADAFILEFKAVKRVNDLREANENEK